MSDEVKSLQKTETAIHIMEELMNISFLRISRTEYKLAIFWGIIANVFTSYIVAYDVFLFGQGHFLYISRLIIFCGMFLVTYNWYLNLSRRVDANLESVENTLEEAFDKLDLKIE